MCYFNSQHSIHDFFMELIITFVVLLILLCCSSILLKLGMLIPFVFANRILVVSNRFLVLLTFIEIYISSPVKSCAFFASHIWPFYKTFSKHSTVNKCVNSFYLTFGNFYVISLTKMKKIIISFAKGIEPDFFSISEI